MKKAGIAFACIAFSMQCMESGNQDERVRELSPVEGRPLIRRLSFLNLAATAAHTLSSLSRSASSPRLIDRLENTRPEFSSGTSDISSSSSYDFDQWLMARSSGDDDEGFHANNTLRGFLQTRRSRVASMGDTSLRACVVATMGDYPFSDPHLNEQLRLVFLHNHMAEFRSLYVSRPQDRATMLDMLEEYSASYRTHAEQLAMLLGSLINDQEIFLRACVEDIEEVDEN